MARLIQDEDILQIDAERIDTDTMSMDNPLDEDKLCMSAAADEDHLCTDFGASLTPSQYKADTTLITADNTSITADYTI
jgi:hypothetical protein